MGLSRRAATKPHTLPAREISRPQPAPADPGQATGDAVASDASAFFEENRAGFVEGVSISRMIARKHNR